MKKYISLVLALITVLAFTSCTSNDSYKDSAINKDYVKVGKDDPVYFGDLRNIVNAEDGYYFTEDGWNFLYYFDKESKKVVPVCNMPNCDHNNNSCNAYLGDIRHYSGLWYYDENIYVIGFSNGIMGLYQISKDGSTRKRSCDFLETGNEYSIITTVHRGFAYFSINRGDNKAQVYQVELKENAKPKLIFEFEGIDACVDFVRGYNENIYIAVSSYDDKSYEASTNSLYSYSIPKDAYDKIPIDDLCGHWTLIDDNTLIYRTPNAVMKYDLKADKPTEFYNEPLMPSYDGRYIYLDNDVTLFREMAQGGDEYQIDKRSIKVVDLSGKLIDEIKIKTDGMCYFGDEDYLFIDLNEKISASGEGDTEIQIRDDNSIHLIGTDSITSLMAFDKSQIGTDKHDFTLLKKWDFDSIIG
ncbi:MAG: hypothetical protein K6F76_03475 [Clostridiales bacterium]|nr:hypothetical protein [Clostridiales bacterium]